MKLSKKAKKERFHTSVEPHANYANYTVPGSVFPHCLSSEFFEEEVASRPSKFLPYLLYSRNSRKASRRLQESREYRSH